jgi:alpha-ketoglutarate-dependent taurine dioxygenase
VPSWGAVLRAVNQPPVGGDTIWVDAGKVYRELPEELKKRFEGLHSIVDFRAALQRAGHDYSWWPTPSSAPTARRAKRSSGSTSANTPRSSASPRQRTARSSA